MTKKQRRDKESSAESHRKKINGQDGRPSKAYLSFRGSCRGIVNLAWRCLRGKVSNKARIARASLPVVYQKLIGSFSRDCFDELSEVR